MRKETTASSVGLMAAFAASFCCITPLITLVAGASGAASSLSWLAPYRPYLIVVAVLALGVAWVQFLRTDKTAQCGVDRGCTAQKKSFLGSRSFLLLVTVSTALIAAFPLYAKAFYPQPQVQTMVPTTVTTITEAINKTGYKVLRYDPIPKASATVSSKDDNSGVGNKPTVDKNEEPCTTASESCCKKN